MKTGFISYPIRISVLLAILFALCTGAVYAQKGKGKRLKSKKPASGSKGSSRSSGKNVGPPPDIRFLYVDGFLGYGINRASGDYFGYQETYYESANPSLVLSGKFNQFNVPTGGVQVRINPFHTHHGFLSLFSANVGLSYISRGFSHEISLVNQKLDYLDQTRLTETYRASFVGMHYMVRVGRKLYAETGLSLDFFAGGRFTRELVRSTSGENAFGGSFTVTEDAALNLTSKVMKPLGPAWVAAAGYQIMPQVGVRIFYSRNGSYFGSEPNLRNSQISFQLNGTFGL